MQSLNQILSKPDAKNISPTNMPTLSKDSEADTFHYEEKPPISQLIAEEPPDYLYQDDLFPEWEDETKPEEIQIGFEWREFPGRTVSTEDFEVEQGEEICPHCGGTGYVVLDLPVRDPDFGRAISCGCQEQAMAIRRQSYLQTLSGVDTLSRLNFENFVIDPIALQVSIETAHNLQRARDLCLQFAYEPEGWLILMGRYGCGKTHLAAAIANANIRTGNAVTFMVVPDLLDHLRSTFSPRSELSYDDLFEQMRNTPLLILDDLGTQSSTPWAQEKLFQLLNHRYNTQAATVITTNQRLDNLDQRLHSRLQDIQLVQQFAITAPDYRANKQVKESDLSSLEWHKEQTFESFESYRRDLNANERENLHQTAEACRRFAEAKRPEGWLVLSGGYGSGKTHLAAAIANHQSDQARNEVMFVVVPDLLDHLRAAFSPDSNMPYDRRFDEIKNTPLLILDDLGTESATPWAKEKLFQLLNHRYNARRATVITTSSGPDEIEPRLRTRMFDTQRCKFFAITAHSYRGNQANR